MKNDPLENYIIGFFPYAMAAFLVGIVGGFTAVLGPAFVKDLNLDYNNTAWTSLAMAVSTATFAPVMGKLGDVYGRKKILLLGLVIFTVGNVLTAVAGSLFAMIAARFIVGVGSASIAPSVMAYVAIEFPQEKVGKGFALYMLISSAAVIFGPTIGGFIIEKYGWRQMMLVCTFISALVLLLCLAKKGKIVHRRKTINDFDLAGSLLVLLFFAFLLCVPAFGQNIGWDSLYFYIVTVSAIILGVLLFKVEKRASSPVLQLNFIKRKSFVLSVATLFLTQGLMQANMTNIIVFVNYAQPENTIISSYAISIMYIGMSVGSVLIGPLADKYEPKQVLLCSLALTGVGCGLMLLFRADTKLGLMALSLGVLGLGLGGNAAIFMKVVLSGLPEQMASSGTGTYGLFRDLAAPFGVAVFVPLFANSITRDIEAGKTGALAAVNGMKMLSVIEICCIAAGMIIVLLLPKIYENED